MCGTAWNNFCLPTNTNKYYIFSQIIRKYFWHYVVTYIMTRNGNSCFFPPFFATSLFLFVGRLLELLATVLFAFIRLSANSHEKSRSVLFFMWNTQLHSMSFAQYPTIYFCNIYKVPKDFDIAPLGFYWYSV